MTLVASNGHQLHSPLGTPCDDGDGDDDDDADGDDGDDDGGGDVVRFPYIPTCFWREARQSVVEPP